MYTTIVLGVVRGTIVLSTTERRWTRVLVESGYTRVIDEMLHSCRPYYNN